MQVKAGGSCRDGFGGAIRQFRNPTKSCVAGRLRKLERVTCLASPVPLLQRLLRRQSSTPKVVPGAALPWLVLGRVGG